MVRSKYILLSLAFALALLGGLTFARVGALWCIGSCAHANTATILDTVTPNHEATRVERTPTMEEKRDAARENAKQYFSE